MVPILLPALVMTFLSVAFAACQGGGPARPEERRPEGITAEVRGTLRFQPGQGYFVVVKAARFPDQENRVWLMVPESKVLVRKLEGLTGKRVVVRGQLDQLPPNASGSSIPPHGLFIALSRDEGIEADGRLAPGKAEETTPPFPNKDDSTARLLRYLEQDDLFIRAAAVDLLGARKAREAVPKLIDLLTDYRALPGSDNWVGAHAANALSEITGRPFNIDQKEWRQWWQQQPGAGK